jgi:hypothetical protein
MILEYEIVKYDADLGSPNAFVCLDGRLSGEKVGLLLKHFGSQSDKHWFTEDLLMSIMRIRGVEACSREKYAEAFYCRKFIV